MNLTIDFFQPQILRSLHFYKYKFDSLDFVYNTHILIEKYAKKIKKTIIL